MAEVVSKPHMENKIEKKSRVLAFGLTLLVVVILTAAVIVYLNIRNRESDLEAALKQQQETFAASYVQAINTWLGDLKTRGDRLINADMFRLFASNVNDLGGNVSLLFADPSRVSPDQQQDFSDISGQLPLMQNMLRDFANYAEFSQARIINSRAETYIDTESSINPLSEVQKSCVAATFASGQVSYAPLRNTSNGLTMDIFMPILPPQADPDTKPVAVLMLSKIVSSQLFKLLEPMPLPGKEMSTILVQYDGKRAQEISPWGAEALRSLSEAGEFAAGENVPFAMRDSLRKGVVYSLGLKVPGLSWWIFQEADYDSSRTDLGAYVNTSVGIAVLITVMLALFVSGLWWWLIGRENKEIANEFKDLLEVIDEQKELLDGINSTIADLISLTDDKGVIQYANRSFAEAVGRPVEEVVGLDIPALFGFDTGKRLIASDHQVLMSGEGAVVNEIIFLRSQKYHFQIVKAPLAPIAGRSAKGIVSVYRDISALVEAEERSQRVVQQTISALVRTIEETDPYLAGHSRFMASLSGQLAKSLCLTDSDAATVEAAANLSQIGKMFVPKEILTKPGALTDEEKRVMEGHVEHSRRVLQNIEFDLPIVAAIYEMNERMDGTGYPRHLKGADISIFGRLLAVTNAFTAMIRPRSYRSAMDVNTIMQILKEQSFHYDAEIVEALERFLETPAGERLLRSLQSTD